MRLRQLDADHRCQPFAHIVSGKRFSLELFRKIRLRFDIGVYGAGQCGLETGKMRSAFNGADIVGKGMNIFLVFVIILKGKLHGHVIRDPAPLYDPVYGLISTVEIFHKLTYAAFGIVFVRLVGAFVHTDDFQPSVQIGQFFKTLLKYRERKFCCLKYLVVRQETHRCAMSFRLAEADQLRHRIASLIALPPASAVPTHSDFQPFGKRIHTGNADTVQTAGYLVGIIIELAAGMQLGHDYLYGRNTEFGVYIHRNTTPVVAYGDTVVHVQNHFHMGTVPGHGLVDGVVHYFIHKMMQPA